MGRQAARTTHRLWLGFLILGLVASWTGVGLGQAPATFAARIAQLSERGGFFDTDNLISNEGSYLHVLPALRDGRVTGGVYLGVGPDQNFSYIARIRPDVAYIVDIRRDNMLLHLLFKSLFDLSETRIDYLSLLFARPSPERIDPWRQSDLDKIVAYVDGAKGSEARTAQLRARVDAKINSYGVPLSTADFETIDRFHRTFINAGTGLQFQSTGRAPRGYYPTNRQLLFETDRQGHRGSFLASEDDFQFVRSLERRNLVIPVIGDLSGTTAIAAIGRLLASRGEKVSAFYVSNVEFYLFGAGTIDGFVNNLKRLPHTDRSVVIRSIFGGFNLPESVPGYYSTSQLQPIDDLLRGFAAGRFHSYTDVLFTR